MIHAPKQLHDFQSRGADFLANRRQAYLADEMGVGKAQPLSARILTPAGWSTMGAMRVGAQVIGASGKACTVVGVFPQGVRDVYTVTFSDGTTARCDREHLWSTQDANQRRRGHGWKVQSVDAMLRAGVLYKQGTSKWRVPLMGPADFTGPPLLIHPYVLGVLIGDGYLARTPAFSVPPGKIEILERVRAILGPDKLSGPHGTLSSPQWKILGEKHKYSYHARAVASLGLNIGSLARFIPATYQQASAADRLELLRGLMDTDGSHRHGRNLFHSGSEQLARDVVDLVRSLGGVATLATYDRPDKGTEWRVNVRMPVCPFHITPKARSWTPPERTHGKYITAIERTGSEEQQCIAVDAPDSLYVTDGYNVTHNTPQLTVALDRAGAKRALIIAPAIIEEDWTDTLADFAPNRTPAHVLRDPGKIPTTGDVVCSYNRAEMHSEVLRKIKWDALICDEAHALKNPDASRTRAILNPIYGGKNSIAAACGAVWLASGTPMPNDAAELWAALRTAGLYAGRYWDFAREFCHVYEIQIGRDKKQVVGKVRNAAGLTQLLKGYMLLRTTAEVLPELPPLRIGTLEVPGGEVNRSDPILPILAQLDADAHDAIEAAIAAGDWSMQHVPHLATIRRLTGLAKAATAADHIRLELECRFDKVAVFGLHTDVLKYLQHELRDFNPIMLTGAESQKKRRASIREFQNGTKTRLAIGQSKAAGAGITLTASNRMHVIEASWTHADNMQVFKRINRFGQHKECFGDYWALQGSSDVKVTKAFTRKADASRQILTSELTG